MKYIFAFFTITFLFPAYSFCQGIRGKILHSSNKPVQYASIYIKELSKGTISGVEGDFEINLPPGIYTVYFHSLGYQTEKKEIRVESGFVELEIILLPREYKIKEVEVKNRDEDPAYPIIRKAIATASYHRKQVSHYFAKLYLKGSAKVINIPLLLKNKAVIEVNNKEVKIKEGDTFVMESLSELTYDAPDKYHQKVISSRSSLPGQDEADPMNYMTSSFYQPKFGEIVSPLSSHAFTYYRFRYEGYFYEDNDIVVNKIRVIPKRKGQHVFSGFINIVDGFWNIHSVDLTNNSMIGKITARQIYAPVKENAWLPVSHTFRIDFSMIGVEVKATYHGSVEYKDIRLNKTISAPTLITEKKTEDSLYEDLNQPKKSSKYQQKIEKILKKDDLTNRDVIRMARLAKKEKKKQAEQEKKPGEKLKIEEKTNNVTIENKPVSKDSISWDTIRPVPLSTDELKSYELKDSLVRKPDSLAVDAKKSNKKSFLQKTWHFVVKPKTLIKKDSIGFNFTYSGLVRLDQIEFNTIDGWVYGQRFTMKRKNGNWNYWSVNPFIAYAFNRESLLWEIPFECKYNSLKRAGFSFSIGHRSVDFNEKYGINPVLNTFSSLLFRENYRKLYDKQFIRAENTIDIANGLQMKVQMQFARFSHLQTHSDFSIFYSDSKSFSANRPKNDLYAGKTTNDMRAAMLGLQFEYTPEYYYKITNGKKVMQHSGFPTFHLQYRKGLPNVFHSASDFDYLEAGVRQNIEIGLFSEFQWNILAGKFLRHENMHFAEIKHFNAQKIPVLLDNFENTFMLPGYYQLSTGKQFLEAHLRYTTPYLLLKLLPIIRDRMWNENLYVNYLYTPRHKHYQECGYSLGNILFFADIGVFAGWYGEDFHSVGVKLSFSLN